MGFFGRWILRDGFTVEGAVIDMSECCWCF